RRDCLGVDDSGWPVFRDLLSSAVVRTSSSPPVLHKANVIGFGHCRDAELKSEFAALRPDRPMTKKTPRHLFGARRWSIGIAGIAYVLGKLSWPDIVAMVQKANPIYLAASVLIFPLTFLITGIRWHWLMQMLGIRISLARAFVLNMVGAFYNTFMPGSTGGDVLKAYYVSKFTDMRTHAVMSVIVDRLIGLVALI